MIKWLVSFIRFAIESILKLILLIFFLILVSLILHMLKIKVRFDPDWYLHSDYRQLLSFSEIYQSGFVESLESKAVHLSDDIYIRDMTPFKWDTVCFLAGYAPYREDMAGSSYTNKDFPVLEYYGLVAESNHSLVFVSEDKVVAVFESIGIQTINLSHKGCASVEKARFHPISIRDYDELIMSKSPRHNISEDDLNRLPKCRDSKCMVIFKVD